VRNKTQYTSFIFPMGLLWIFPGRWCRCVEAAKSGAIRLQHTSLAQNGQDSP
jgi:hypothetical protein